MDIEALLEKQKFNKMMSELANPFLVNLVKDQKVFIPKQDPFKDRP